MNMVENMGWIIWIFRFGTLKSIFSTMYGNEIKEIIKNSGKDAFYYIVGKVSSIVNHQIHGGN